MSTFGVELMAMSLISPNSAFEILKIDFFCDFAPGPSLGIVREDQPTL